MSNESEPMVELHGIYCPCMACRFVRQQRADARDHDFARCFTCVTDGECLAEKQCKQSERREP